MKEGLPSRVQRLFWDADILKIDPDIHADAIMERVLNYGDLGDWQWLARRYGEDAIRQKLSGTSTNRRDNLRPESRRVASLVFKAQ